MQIQIRISIKESFNFREQPSTGKDTATTKPALLLFTHEMGLSKGIAFEWLDKQWLQFYPTLPSYATNVHVRGSAIEGVLSFAA